MKGVSDVFATLLLAIIVISLIGAVASVYFGFWSGSVSQRFTIEQTSSYKNHLYFRNIGTSPITSLKSITLPNGTALDYYIDANKAFLMSTDFSDGTSQGWVPISGTWTVQNGRYRSDSTTTGLANSSYAVNYSSTNSFIEFKFKLGDQQSLRKNLDVMLVVDTSSSMAGQKIIDAQTSAKTFVDQMDPLLDREGLVNFSITNTFMQGLTFDQNIVKSKIDQLNVSSGTNIGSGIYRANQELTTNNRTGATLVQVLMTDGEVNEPGGYSSGRSYMMSAATQAASNGIRIFTIGFNIASGSAAENDLKQVASMTGGLYFFAPDAATLKSAYLNISGQITKPIPQGASAGMIEADPSKNPLVKISFYSGNFTEIRDMTDGTNVTNYFPFNFSSDYDVKVVNQLTKVLLYVNNTKFGEKTVSNTAQQRGQLILFTSNVTALFDEITIKDGNMLPQETGYIVITSVVDPGTPVTVCTTTDCQTVIMPSR